MPTPNPQTDGANLPRVGVTADAATMTTEQLVRAIDSSEASYMDQLWESSYLFADLYRRKEWTVGLNSRPTNAHFVAYVQQLYPARGYTENDLMTRVDCYNAYARLEDPEVINLIKQMGNLTKARTAIPWVLKHPTKAKEILQLCLVTSALNLRPALRAKFPMRTGELPARKEGGRGNGVSGESVINYLATHDVNVIANEIFVPRNTARKKELEFAWFALVKSYLLKNTKISLDDVFGQMVQTWLDSLDPTSRSELLDEARPRWIHAMELNDGDIDAWPFEMPGEEQPTV